MHLSLGLDHPLAAFLVFMALSLWALRAYAHSVPPLPRSRRLLLTALRVTASLLLSLMLGGFGATLTREQSEPALLRILVDASASMARPAQAKPGASQAASRYEEAKRTAAAIEERWGDRLAISVGAFGLGLLEGPLPETAKEAGTDLGGALAALPAPRPGESVLLLSDGRDTEGALWAAKPGTERPVHAIMLGDSLPPADLRIEQVEAPPLLHKGMRLPLSVEISSVGGAPRAGKLALREGGKLLAESDWSLGPGEEHKRLEIPLVLDEAGQHLVELRVLGDGDKAQADAAPENERRLIPLRVLEGKLRVLVLGGRPDWDLAALLRSLRAEESLEITLVSAGPDGSPQDAATGAPWEPQSKDYHALVLHSLHEGWDETLLDKLRLRGGAFLMGSYCAQARPSDLVRIWSLTAPARAPQRSEAHVAWGTGAQRHPAVQALCAAVPELRDLAPLEETRPNPLDGGRVLLQDEERPVLLTRELGGRSLAVCSARGFWRWPLHSEEGAEILGRLYSGLLRWLAREDPPDRLVVDWGGEGLWAGQAGSLRAELFDEDFQPLGGARLDWSLRAGDSLLARGVFSEEAGARRYAAALPALPEGVYRLEVAAKTAGGEELSRDLDLPILPPERELLYPAASAETLRWLAARSGGVFLPAVDLAALEAALDFTPQRRTLTRALRIWQDPLLFLLLLGLLAAEWGFRKRFGMV